MATCHPRLGREEKEDANKASVFESKKWMTLISFTSSRKPWFEIAAISVIDTVAFRSLVLFIFVRNVFARKRTSFVDRFAISRFLFFCLSRMSPTGNGPFWSTRIAFLRECLPNVSELGIVANGSAAGFTNGCRLVMAASDPDGQGGFYPLLSFFFPVCVCVGVCLFIDDRSTAFDRRAKEMQPVARRTWSQKPPDHDLVLSLSR